MVEDEGEKERRWRITMSREEGKGEKKRGRNGMSEEGRLIAERKGEREANDEEGREQKTEEM